MTEEWGQFIFFNEVYSLSVYMHPGNSKICNLMSSHENRHVISVNISYKLEINVYNQNLLDN